MASAKAASNSSPLSSMTGFARAEGASGAFTWAWEFRSVNNRGLDVRVRVPGGLDQLDHEARKRLSARFKRGSIQANLQLARAEGTASLQINEEALSQVLEAMGTLKTRVEAAPPTLDGILALRGILEMQDTEETDEEREARVAALMESFDEGLERLEAARRSEGVALTGILTAQIDDIERLLAGAEALSALQPDKIRARLREQLALLTEAASAPLPEERIAQEAAALMTKADVREELDRLKAHIASARELLSGGGSVGRRLDFLIQEFNRESNTLCAKSPDMELTKIGLELKAVIDQLREQVQNLE